jgi:hypothetical protein
MVLLLLDVVVVAIESKARRSDIFDPVMIHDVYHHRS